MGNSPRANGYKGAAIGDFIARRQIGKGRNAAILSATCVRTGQRVAIKSYFKAGLTPVDVHRVKREISILVLLRHEHIIKWLGHFEDDECIHIVQEWAAGGDLFEELKSCGNNMSEQRIATKILWPLIQALHHMHSRGVVHRDLKPENLLLTARGRLKVCDFGLAINMKLETPSSRLGTLQYMSPEVVCRGGAKGAKAGGASPLAAAPYNGMVDVWACGILVYELIMGKPPFEGKTDEQTTSNILNLGIRSAELPGIMSGACRDFIEKTLRKEPSQRLNLHQMASHPFLTAYIKGPSPALPLSPAPLKQGTPLVHPAPASPTPAALPPTSPATLLWAAHTPSGTPGATAHAPSGTPGAATQQSGTPKGGAPAPKEGGTPRAILMSAAAAASAPAPLHMLPEPSPPLPLRPEQPLGVPAHQAPQATGAAPACAPAQVGNSSSSSSSGGAGSAADGGEGESGAKGEVGEGGESGKRSRGMPLAYRAFLPLAGLGPCHVAAWMAGARPVSQPGSNDPPAVTAGSINSANDGASNSTNYSTNNAGNNGAGNSVSSGVGNAGNIGTTGNTGSSAGKRSRDSISSSSSAAFRTPAAGAPRTAQGAHPNGQTVNTNTPNTTSTCTATNTTTFGSTHNTSNSGASATSALATTRPGQTTHSSKAPAGSSSQSGPAGHGQMRALHGTPPTPPASTDCAVFGARPAPARRAYFGIAPGAATALPLPLPGAPEALPRAGAAPGAGSTPQVIAPALAPAPATAGTPTGAEAAAASRAAAGTATPALAAPAPAAGTPPTVPAAMRVPASTPAPTAAAAAAAPAPAAAASSGGGLTPPWIRAFVSFFGLDASAEGEPRGGVDQVNGVQAAAGAGANGTAVVGASPGGHVACDEGDDKAVGWPLAGSFLSGAMVLGLATGEDRAKVGGPGGGFVSPPGASEGWAGGRGGAMRGLRPLGRPKVHPLRAVSHLDL